ncbi:hypothetical protein FOCG_08542 [Fusarium oxysporum f. sp. radicis-lycopersici 26381]|uniref:Uncharacterized protein n=1 Tax=Fusarium oxysporum Fo47 TaxID=660027 RepID=W9JG07_FUSOX|nr:hypothetical protein FOZG_17723 [Fusarium oxysporum Fo47]EXL52779.1 hypothetical protein FOCG_08542 [Fusarium oxysporum f. sp. radicis-lycopersici 26381]
MPDGYNISRAGQKTFCYITQTTPTPEIKAQEP